MTRFLMTCRKSLPLNGKAGRAVDNSCVSKKYRFRDYAIHNWLTRVWGGVFLVLCAEAFVAQFEANAATLTVLTNKVADTADLLAYNSGHFYPGSNTRGWWDYSGVSGARVFLTASLIEPGDDIPGYGDGVTNQASFLNRKAALRSNPLNTSYINWPFFTYGTTAKHGANRLRVNDAFPRLRQLGVQILVNISATLSYFTVTDWPGKWELWQHYYAQAFYLAREFDVQRFQMFNEPNHSSAGGITEADYLQRLQLASDAIQSALADVNVLYGKSLTPQINAPVITTPTYNSWGQTVVNNRHQNFLGQSDPSFWLLHRYDYHQYNSTPAQFGSSLASLRSALASAMSPEPALPVSISEFNVHTAANFDAIPETLDSPSKYPRFGAIVVNLVQNFESELYAFKFSQTDGDVGDNYPVRKNGMHYVDNDTAPYNIGGITKAGEVWRLFNKGFAPGRERKNYTADSGLSNLALLASYDPATGRYYVFSANDSATSTSLTVDVSAFNIQDNNRVLIEEVSENSYSAVTHYTRVFNGQVSTFTQPGNSVWLVTVPSKPQHFVSPDVPMLLIYATNDATVKDGANKNTNYGTQTNLVVRNDPANAANRSATFIKFDLPRVYLPDVQLAVLSVHASTISNNATAQAHVYGLTNDNWTQSAITWASAPNLRQNLAAGNRITHNVISGLGDSAFLQGQLVSSSTTLVEQQIDVTDFIRSQTNYDATFLISQDPRWNVTLPSLAPGDTQPDGIRIVSLEGAGSSPAPRLRFVRLRDTDGDGISDESETNVFGTHPITFDTDADGWSDGVEALVHGTSPTNADTDGDGVKDGDEGIAGTDPKNSNSYLRVLSIQRTPNTGFRLEWPAVSNRFYRIFQTTTVTNGVWQEIYAGPGTNALMSYTDPMTDDQIPARPVSFYRIRVEP